MELMELVAKNKRFFECFNSNEPNVLNPSELPLW